MLFGCLATQFIAGSRSCEGSVSTPSSDPHLPARGCRCWLRLESWPVPRNSISRRIACPRYWRQPELPAAHAYGVVLDLDRGLRAGLGLIVFSRHEREQRATAASTTTTTTQADTTPPTLNDHWQVALSVHICGTVINLPRSADQSSGIITDGKGVVDIYPAARRQGREAIRRCERDPGQVPHSRRGEPHLHVAAAPVLSRQARWAL